MKKQLFLTILGVTFILFNLYSVNGQRRSKNTSLSKSNSSHSRELKSTFEGKTTRSRGSTHNTNSSSLYSKPKSRTLKTTVSPVARKQPSRENVILKTEALKKNRVAQSESKKYSSVANIRSRVFEVSPYKAIRGVEGGLEAHHVGQRALMSRFVPEYNQSTAPSILVPKLGHTQGAGVLSRRTSGVSNARQVLARDIIELRRVYPNVPNSSLQKLIQMNKSMYPRAFVK